MNEYLLFIFTTFVILREFMCVNACVLTAPVCSVNPAHVCLFLHAALSLTHIPKLFNIREQIFALLIPFLHVAFHDQSICGMRECVEKGQNYNYSTVNFTD